MGNLKMSAAGIASAAVVAIAPASATVVEISGTVQAFATELESDFFERSGPLAPGDDLDFFGSVRENNEGVIAGSEVIADLAAGTFRLFTTAEILDSGEPAPFGQPADARARVAFETTFTADGNGQVQFLASIDGDIDFASGFPNAGAGGTFTLQNALGQIIAEQFYSFSDQPDSTIFLSTIVEPGEELTLLFDFSMFASADQPGELVVNDFSNTISFAVLTADGVTLRGDGSGFFSDLLVPEGAEVPLPAAAWLFAPALLALRVARGGRSGPEAGRPNANG